MKGFLKSVAYIAVILVVIAVARVIGGAAGRNSAVVYRASHPAVMASDRSSHISTEQSGPTVAKRAEPVSSSADVGDEHFTHVQLVGGISIDIPKHWQVHTSEERQNFATAAEGALRDARLDYDTSSGKQHLLAISSLPAPSGAKIRLNVIRPKRYSAAELRSATPADLDALRLGLETQLKNNLL